MLSSVAAAVLATGFPATSYAADTDLAAPVFVNRPGWAGFGLDVGNVQTGATAKLWTSSKTAVQAALGDRPEGNAARANVDLVYNPRQWMSPDGHYALPAYLGLGATVGHSFSSGPRAASTELGFRVPVGMSILVRDNPVELFFEIAPELTVRTPGSQGRYTFYMDGAIGLRVYP